MKNDSITKELLSLVQRIDIAPGKLTIALDAVTLADLLNVQPDIINPEALVTNYPFRLRRRGVETKIILADQPTSRDETLIRNIAKAYVWFERIKAGESFAQIATTDGISKRRVQQMIDLAFLAPDIIRDVLSGKQPTGFTTEWCKTHSLPADWTEQRALLATL